MMMRAVTIAMALTVTLGLGCDDGATSTPTSDVNSGTDASGTDTGALNDTGSQPDVPQTEDAIAPPAPGGKCNYVATDQGTGGGFGAGCTSNADCKWSECLQTFEEGNLTNAVFGFCTRGCDCGSTETTLSADDKVDFMCLYPPGSQGRLKHVVVRCNSFADCTALDSRWTACKLPSAGGLQAVCHAELPLP